MIQRGKAATKGQELDSPRRHRVRRVIRMIETFAFLLFNFYFVLSVLRGDLAE
jgi:hypothetical protein